MGAAAGDAGVGIADEAPVETLRDGVVNKVMHDAVPELRGPHLADLRVGDYERDTAADPVASFREFPIQRDQVALQLRFEPELVDRIPLCPPAIEISVEDGINRELRIRDHDRSCENSARERGSTSGTTLADTP